jgi:hypothetical protein
MKTAPSITEKIGKHLVSGKSITALQALEKFGCMRLGARIYDLRMDGWDIAKSSMHLPNGKTVAKYRLAIGGK